MIAVGRVLQHEILYWMPVEGARHAIHGATGSHEVGARVWTLCDELVQAREASWEDWIGWRSCQSCWEAAKVAFEVLARTGRGPAVPGCRKGGR